MAPTLKATAKSAEKSLKQPPLSELDPTFTYICHDILELPEDSPTILALREAEILNIRLLMTFEEYEIDQLTYTPIGMNTTKLLVMGCCTHIKLFTKWYNHLRDERGVSELMDEQWRETRQTRVPRLHYIFAHGTDHNCKPCPIGAISCPARLLTLSLTLRCYQARCIPLSNPQGSEALKKLELFRDSPGTRT